MVGKTKKNEWFYRVKILNPITGKRIEKYKSGFLTKKEAIKAGDQIKRELENNPSDFYEFKDLVNRFLADQRNRNQTSTVEGKERNLRNYILPYFEDKTLEQIDKKFVLSWASEINSIKHLSNRTKNDITGLLKFIFAFGDIELDIPKNPTRAIRALPERSKKYRILTRDEFKKVMTHISQEDEEEFLWLVFFSVLFNSGARRGEIQALKFSDLNFESKMIRIDKTYSSKHKNKNEPLKHPKTESSVRTIPLDDNTFQLLRKVYERRIDDKNFSRDNFIFRRPDNPSLPFADTTVERRKNILIRKSKVPHFTVHDFRHPYVKRTTKKLLLPTRGRTLGFTGFFRFLFLCSGKEVA